MIKVKQLRIKNSEVERRVMNKRNNLMVAYIIAIAVAIVVKLVYFFTNRNFDAWSRIIVATTISTYCFSIADIYKTTCNLYKIRSEKIAELSEKAKEYSISLRNEKDYNKESVQKVNDFIRMLTESVDNESKRYKNNQFVYNAFYIIGFVSFLVITMLGIDIVDVVGQEVMVMLAFVIMLSSDYLYDVLKRKYDKKFDVYNEAMDALIGSCRLEEEHENDKSMAQEKD